MAATSDTSQTNAWDVCTRRQSRINQSGKWEHERLAKILFRVYRHLNDDSVISSAQLCPAACTRTRNNALRRTQEITSENYFLLSSTHSGNVHLTDVDTGNTINTIKFKMENKRIPEVHKARYSAETDQIGISCMDGTIGTFFRDGECTFTAKLGGSCQDFDVEKKNPNMFSTVCDIDNSVLLFDTRAPTKTPIFHLKDHHEQTPTSVAFVAGNKIATAGMDGHLKILDISTRRVLINIKEDNVISSITCDPFERRTVVTTSWNKTVKLYDIATGVYRNNINQKAGGNGHTDSSDDEMPHYAHHGCVSCAAFLNQEFLVTGAYDRHAILWSIGKNNVLDKRLDMRGHSDWITGIDGTADAKCVLTSSRDGTLRLWNLEHAFEPTLTVADPDDY